jgi:hypothetical protein
MVVIEIKTSAKIKKKWPESASELYQPSDLRLSARLVPIFADRRVSHSQCGQSYGRNLGFLGQSRYFFFQLAPQLYSRGWVGPVPDPLLLRKSGNAGNLTQTSGSNSQELWLLDHGGGQKLSTDELKLHETYSLRPNTKYISTCAIIALNWQIVETATGHISQAIWNEKNLVS